MKNFWCITLILIVVFASTLPVFASGLEEHSCYITSNYGYDVGYTAGVQEKRDGYSFEPNAVINQPIFQAALKEVKQTSYITPDKEPEFDRCFRKGFYEGYSAGYRGLEKRNTGYDDKKPVAQETTVNSPGGEGYLCDGSGKCWQLTDGEIKETNVAEKK